jgi:hypothetical protein
VCRSRILSESERAPKKKKLLSALNQIPICRLSRKMASFVHHGMRQIRRSCGAFAFLVWVGVCLGAVVHEVQAQAGLTSAVAAASAPALASGSLDSSSTGSDPEAPPPAIGYYKAHGWLLWLAFGVSSLLVSWSPNTLKLLFLTGSIFTDSSR